MVKLRIPDPGMDHSSITSCGQDSGQVLHCSQHSFETRRRKSSHSKQFVGCFKRLRSWEPRLHHHPLRERLRAVSPQKNDHEELLLQQGKRLSVIEGSTRSSRVWAHDSFSIRNRVGHEKLIKYEPTAIKHRSWIEGNDRMTNARRSDHFWADKEHPTCSTSIPQASTADFALLPFDVLRQIAGSFSWADLWAATRVCRSWNQALAPLREGMLFLEWGKKWKHGRGGVSCNLGKALDSFQKGAIRGCAAAMVDAGLLLWELGRQEEGIRWYKQAADLGCPAGQCNLGLAYMLADSSDLAEAVKWFQLAAEAGHARAQYSLALCLHQGWGVDRNMSKAGQWYLKAAKGGSSRAMYNLALCYRSGEGTVQNYREARHWMKCAAMAGHRKAQFEHGLTLFAEGDGRLALVFLELATRAGETGAKHIRDILLQQLSPKSRAHAISCADKFQEGKW
ncbi:unnamed protein product [Sphagnum troendelagicum]